MKNINWAMTSEPSARAAVRTPVSAVSSLAGPALIPTVVVDQPVARLRVTADAPSSLPQAHQAPAQVGPYQDHLGAVDGGNGFNGSTVMGFTTGAAKRFAAAARGVPPRGRPV